VLAEDEFLPVDEAFMASVEADLHGLVVHFDIAENYSLYRDRIRINVITPGVNLGRVDYPAGETHTDAFFGPQVVYVKEANLAVPVACKQGAESIVVEVSYQGCADAGLCYPDEHRQFHVELPEGMCTGT
jgi:thiol:disulfide interchange protein DsbD